MLTQRIRKGRKKENARDPCEKEEVCLDARVSSGFTRRNDLGKHDYFLPLLFPGTQGSRLLQEGRALPRHASLEGFLQATSRLFGCHWDCLKRICFCTILQGAPHQEKSRSPLSTWHAVMHLSILRLRGWASVCKLGVCRRCSPQMWVDL